MPEQTDAAERADFMGQAARAKELDTDGDEVIDATRIHQKSIEMIKQQRKDEQSEKDQIELERTARKAKMRQRVLLRKQKKGTCALTPDEEAELKTNATLIIQNSVRQKAVKKVVEEKREDLQTQAKIEY